MKAVVRAYNIKSVHLYGAASRRNFPDGYLAPKETPVDNRVAQTGQRRED